MFSSHGKLYAANQDGAALCYALYNHIQRLGSTLKNLQSKMEVTWEG